MNTKSQVLQNHYRAINSGCISDGTLTEGAWLAILKTHDFKCVNCLIQPKVLCIDHIRPLCKGGHNSADNVQPLCRRCNSIKGKHDNGVRIEKRITSCALIFADEKEWLWDYCTRQNISLSQGHSRAIAALKEKDDGGKT